MTRAGGKTILRRRPRRDGSPELHYEIALASRLLAMSFGDAARPVQVCGLACHSRLEAMQRIMEHEIIHLTELLVWGKSSCRGVRFKALANQVFGHTGTRHDLVTPREVAAVRHGVRVGGWVAFDFQGSRYSGRVNRIHRRATVLVEASDGTPYSDGRRYQKFYVPLPALQPVPGGDPPAAAPT